ncbi:MAG TPA: hypothetical protein VF981_07795 [Gemmatimonadaceae bacterium]
MQPKRRIVCASALFGVCLVSAPVEGQGQPRMMVVVQDLSWSRDGGKLFFSAMRVRSDYSDYVPGKWSVYSYEPGSGAVERIAPNSFSVGASPTAALIVVGKLVNGNRDLYVLDEDGREVTRLTADPAEDFGGAWSPDWRWIAFTSKRNGRSEAFVADADGSNPRRLIEAGSDRTLNPAWSPDGSLVAYYREKGGRGGPGARRSLRRNRRSQRDERRFQ